MPDSETALEQLIKNGDPATAILVIVCICAVLYAYRKQLYEVFETYVMGNLFKKSKKLEDIVDDDSDEEEQKDEKSSQVTEILQMLSELKEELSSVKEQQIILSGNQDRFQKEIESIASELVDSKDKMNQIFDSQEFLMMADKEDKKAYITREYNHFYVQLQKIDLYSKETIEKIYEIYLKENGDTFVAGMMTSIRSLPVVPQITAEDLLIADPRDNQSKSKD